MEEWRPVPGFPNVEASSLGRIRTLTRVLKDGRTWKGQVMTPWQHQGYAHVSVNGKNRKVSQLVCRAFHGEPPLDKPNALHGDGDSSNNLPGNLRWGTNHDNMQDAAKHGTLSQRGILTKEQTAEIRSRRAAGERGYKLALEFGVSQQTICDVHKGRIA